MAVEGQALCILMTVTCGLSYLLYGYDQGFMSGVLYESPLLPETSPGHAAYDSQTRRRLPLSNEQPILLHAGSSLQPVYSRLLLR